MRTIWKYQLSEGEPTIVTGGARLLIRHVGADPAGNPEIPSVWVELDDDVNVPQETAKFIYIGTGQPVPEGVHVGSCVVSGGFVWHVFVTREVS